ncbi:hydantoinase B/oxoprolinase family protein [Streptomyces sp. 8L]|uniref:hydantoinase B/oxoprolinase family protein n=1 Tax=Streptomyces sp. 8L TaxID=2877242 RepID=UPI001CD5D89B|nr:hydantoinase B/oxoprolinase family protein [Streptomyces sp. 8L]MCA1217032.1 hydantoinase B/oxoprolinase family protein [Streptomyces sp. 8L]
MTPASTSATGLDPITTEVIGSAVFAITEEMSGALMRTAYSPNIRERGDCSTGLFDARGRVLAQSQRLPLHMGSLLGSVRAVHERHPVESLKPGDMFVANDPYHGGGSHLPDVNVVAPVFHRGRLVGYAASTAHHSDVGGTVAGSESADCREIFQEGLRLPPVKIVDGGTVNEDVIAVVALNSRVPGDRGGDLRAQIAANRVAEQRLTELAGRYGTETLQEYVDALLEATERRIRARYAEITPGVYEHDAYMDPLPDGTPLRIHVRLEVTGGRLMFDFTGSSPQMPYARNIPFAALAATVFCVVKALLDPAIATNDGFYRSVEIHAPEGTIVHPVEPAPVGARALSCGVLADAIAGALSLAAPDRMVAGSGPHQLVIFAGLDERTRNYFVNYETIAGALGATASHDGLDAVRVYASGAANLPVEALERAFPLRVERYELRDDPAGAGAHSGGRGIRRDYRVLSETARISLTGERHREPARGVLGGRDGATGRFLLNPGTENEEELPRIARDVLLRAGDVLRVETPGGAGYGKAGQ